MEITEVKVRRVFEHERLCAIVSIIIDDSIAVHDIKIINGKDRKFVAMPSRREDEGRYRDIVHPLNAESRAYIENTILAEYERQKEKETHEYMNERDHEDDI